MSGVWLVWGVLLRFGVNVGLAGRPDGRAEAGMAEAGKPIGEMEGPESRTQRFWTLGRVYGTDKVSSHAYHVPYGYLLDRPPQKILEIGISPGATLKTWLAYFPEPEVHGMDLHDSRRHWAMA